VSETLADPACLGFTPHEGLTRAVLPGPWRRRGYHAPGHLGPVRVIAPMVVAVAAVYPGAVENQQPYNGVIWNLLAEARMHSEPKARRS